MNSGKSFIGCSQDVFNRNAVPDATFCTSENWQSAVMHLSQEFDNLGFAPPCTNGEESLNVITLINSSWELMQNYRTCVKTITDLETQLQMLHSDMNHLHQLVSRQRDSLDAKARLVQDITEKERQAQLLLQEEREGSRNSKEEIRRLANMMQQKDSQCQHELKRKEQEISSLKERLIKTLASKSGLTEQIGIEISSPVSKADGKQRCKWKTDAGDQKLKLNYYDRLLEDKYCKNEQLQKENFELKDRWIHFLQQIRAICREKVDAKQSTQEENQVLIPNDLSTDAAQSTLRLLKKSLEENPTNNDQQTLLLSPSYENQKTESQRAEIELERQDLERQRIALQEATKRFLLTSSSNDPESPFSIEQGPTWSLGNATCTLPTSTIITGQGVNIGPVFSGSRPPSRPQSRSHSRNRSNNAAANTVVRRQRPRSTNLSPHRMSGVLNPKMVGGTLKLRSGSVSPSSANRLHLVSPRNKPPSIATPPAIDDVIKKTDLISPEITIKMRTTKSDSEDLSVHLARLERLMQRKSDQSSSTTSDSEIEECLESVRKMLRRRKV